MRRGLGVPPKNPTPMGETPKPLLPSLGKPDAEIQHGMKERYRFGLAGESRQFHNARGLARGQGPLSGPRVGARAHFQAERFDGGVGSLLNLRAMPRPSTFATVFLSLCAVALLGGCTRTIYSDMYSPRRNYFKPVKEQPKPTEVLPTTTLPSPSVPPSVPSTVPAIPPPTVAPPDLPPPVPAPVP